MNTRAIRTMTTERASASACAALSGGVRPMFTTVQTAPNTKSSPTNAILLVATPNPFLMEAMIIVWGLLDEFLVSLTNAYGAVNLDRLARAKGTGDRGFVDELQGAANRHAVRDPRDLHLDGLQLPDKIGRGGGPLGIGTRSEDHLGHAPLLHPRHELPYLDVARADTLQRRKRSQKHVVHAAVIPRLFDGDHVLRFLHHADHRVVARRVRADAAQGALAEVEALAAVADALVDLEDEP